MSEESSTSWKKFLLCSRNFCHFKHSFAVRFDQKLRGHKKKHNRKPYEKEWSEMKKQNVYNPKCNAEGRFIIVGLNFFFSRFRGGAISLRSIQTVLFP